MNKQWGGGPQMWISDGWWGPHMWIKKNSLLNIIKGHPPSADLRYGEEDSISQSTRLFAAIKG